MTANTSSKRAVGRHGGAAPAWLCLLALPAAAQQELPAIEAHMSEALRADVRKVVVLPMESPHGKEIGGSYEKETDGLAGGMAKGSTIGDGISTDVGGIPIGIPFPILTLPGALIGGIAGAAEREVQEFRDALAKDLARASAQPLSNDALASDVFWQVRDLPQLEAKILAPGVQLPPDADTTLYVSFQNLAIDVQDRDAVVTVTANATLRRISDGKNLFSRDVSYQDRDELSDWTADDNALWRKYSNFARHFIGREIAGEVFKTVRLNHELTPRESESTRRIKRNEWRLETRSKTPTLAWELELLGGDLYGSWAIAIDDADIAWDIEIYDGSRPVYSASQVRGAQHRVEVELEPCQSYRWSVRPTYHIDGGIKFGEWMRIDGGKRTRNGSVGVNASEAPAYIYDFATLEIDCRAG
jgi:hypothetical protein